MSAPVFLAEPGSLAGYDAGTTYLLRGAEGRHAGVVQRRGAGERLDVVDGDGVRLVGTVASAGADGVLIHVAERVEEPAPAVTLVLVQALAKGDRDELAIEAATEVGVDAVLPWQAERSIVIWRADRAAKSHARWQGTVRAATKQARRARMPAVELAVDGRALVARVRAVVEAGGAAFVLHEDATVRLADAALPGALQPALAGEGSAVELLVVVGPEGGISERELTAMTEAGALPVRLGPHILRTSTAGPVALAVLSVRLNRW